MKSAKRLNRLERFDRTVLIPQSLDANRPQRTHPPPDSPSRQEWGHRGRRAPCHPRFAGRTDRELQRVGVHSAIASQAAAHRERHLFVPVSGEDEAIPLPRSPDDSYCWHGAMQSVEVGSANHYKWIVRSITSSGLRDWISAAGLREHGISI